MRIVERKHPLLAHILLGVAIVPTVFLSLHFGKTAGVPALGVMAIDVALFVSVVLVLDAVKSRNAERRFEAVPLRRSTELREGDIVRVRGVVEGPAALVAPLRGSACIYYRAAALVPSTEPGDPPDEAAVITEGEVAQAFDSFGPLHLDLRAGVRVVGSVPLEEAVYEYPREGDPLGVGISRPYQIRLQVIQAGLELEAVGLVESVDGKLCVGRAGEALRVRLLLQS